MEKLENCVGLRSQRLFGRIIVRPINVFPFRNRYNKGCSAKKLNAKKKFRRPDFFIFYFLRYLYIRINKTKETHYFRTFSFRISKNIFEGVFRGDFFFQRSFFTRYFSSYLFPRGAFKEFFPRHFCQRFCVLKYFCK